MIMAHPHEYMGITRWSLKYCVCFCVYVCVYRRYTRHLKLKGIIFSKTYNKNVGCKAKTTVRDQRVGNTIWRKQSIMNAYCSKYYAQQITE